MIRDVAAIQQRGEQAGSRQADNKANLQVGRQEGKLASRQARKQAITVVKQASKKAGRQVDLSGLLTMPTVMVLCRDRGLPIADTNSPGLN